MISFQFGCQKIKKTLIKNIFDLNSMSEVTTFYIQEVKSQVYSDVTMFCKNILDIIQPHKVKVGGFEVNLN